MDDWNPNLYLKFSTERTQPAIDLVIRLALTDPHDIVDLGCGPGNSTALLRERWPRANIVGIDHSDEMIREARENYPAWKWVLKDIATWHSDFPVDLVFSNAALHWLPNHAELFPKLFHQLRPGGAFAVQMPARFDSRSTV